MHLGIDVKGGALSNNLPDIRYDVKESLIPK